LNEYSNCFTGEANLIQSVLKALDILEAFTQEQHTLGVTELSKRFGYSKGTVHNLLTTLKSRGYIEVDPGTSRYSLGLKILELSQAVRANIEIRDRATPFLRQLAQLSGETVYLTVLYDDHSVYIDTIKPAGRPVNHSDIGLRVPLHCTSVGKAKLAFLSEEEIDRIIERVGLPRFTSNTITDPAQLKAELALTRQRGYAIDNEEHEVAIRCVGAPIWSERGTVIASCSISGPAGRMTDERIAELAPEVMKQADAISRRLGYSGPPPKQTVVDTTHLISLNNYLPKT
jgi:DNA-binding IclR family transcriptional regulator